MLGVLEGMSKPCAQCPWRLSNQEKKHKFGFFTAKNLRRLWKQVRGADPQGCMPQSCHLTDPSHPAHIAVGAKPGAKAQECPGSVILVLREIGKMADAEGVVRDYGLKKYLATRKGGLTKAGIRYWLVNRIGAKGHVVFGGGGPLPEVDQNDPEIGLPEGWVRDA